MASPNALQNPRVVIIGAGFGGLSAAKRLATSPWDHPDRPSQLPPVPTFALSGGDRRTSPADIASPIRGIVRHYQNVNVIAT